MGQSCPSPENWSTNSIHFHIIFQTMFGLFLDKQTTLCLFNELVLDNSKEWFTNSWKDLYESQRHRAEFQKLDSKAACYMVVLTEWKDSGYSPVGKMLVWHAEGPRSEPSTTKIRSASTLCNPTLQREGGGSIAQGQCIHFLLLW